MPNRPKALILLSSYNGETYIAEQIESLINQDYPNTLILIRDDGSTDNTCRILSHYAKKYNQIDVVYGDNVGVVLSFAKLLFLAKDQADYVAFCDQDDVWDKDKITRSINCLESLDDNTPAMYCSEKRIVDDRLNYIGLSSRVHKKVHFRNSLVENIATGCTITINQKALDLLTAPQTSWKEIRMHDWWIYQVVSAFGVVIYDHEPTMSYRQHASNVIGSKTGLAKFKNRASRHFGGDKKRLSRQAEELVRVYGPIMDSKTLNISNDFIKYTLSKNYINKIWYAVRTPLYRQKNIDNIILKFLIALNRV